MSIFLPDTEVVVVVVLVVVVVVVVGVVVVLGVVVVSKTGKITIVSINILVVIPSMFGNCQVGQEIQSFHSKG